MSILLQCVTSTTQTVTIYKQSLPSVLLGNMFSNKKKKITCNVKVAVM